LYAVVRLALVANVRVSAVVEEVPDLIPMVEIAKETLVNIFAWPMSVAKISSFALSYIGSYLSLLPVKRREPALETLATMQ
jgi:hypothetical protein